jgi:hypothetical protein
MQTERSTSRVARDRIADAMRHLQGAIDKHITSLTDAEAEFHQQDFAAWIGYCEATTRQKLRDSIAFVRAGIAGANPSYGRDARATRYVDLRNPFLEYAEAAMARRFSTELQV